MIKKNIPIVFVLVLIFTACQSATPVPTPLPLPTSSQIPTSSPVPTFTIPPTSTSLPPTPTSIPGKVVIPITSMENSIPWLAAAYDPNARPATQYYAFNTTKPPFDNVLVRQAFAAAVDREAVTELAIRLKAANAQPATTIIPSQILGRYLYNEIGIPFNPARAKELLAEAGYSDVSSFPKITLYTSISGSAMPGIYEQTANAIIEMWKENLGVDVSVKIIGSNYFNYLNSNPNGFEIYRFGLAVDEEGMDPSSIIDALDSNGDINGGYNLGHYLSPRFDKLLDQARNEPNAAKRQILYIDAERILCEEQAAIIPLYYWTVR
jgi:oligopeptide transport system substrate-binding protein